MKRNHLVVLCIFLLSMVLAQSSSDFSAVGERVTLKGHTSDVMSVAFSPDGRTLATGSADKTARLWNVSSGQEIMKFTGHTSLVTSVAFSPDGRTLATGSWDKTALIYGTPDFKPVFKVDDKLGELNITAPSGSSIRINDQTGSISQRLAPGRYTVTVTQDGYKTFTQIVTVTIGQTTQVTATLELLPSQLTILVTTPNARVTVNGRLVALDNNRATITINGETKVEVTASGFATQSQTIMLKPGENRSFSFALEPLKTVVSVDVNVLNATVSINGQTVPSFNGVATLTVSGSSATITISAPGFATINRTLNFTPGDAQNLKIELQPSSTSSTTPTVPVPVATSSNTTPLKPREDMLALVIGNGAYTDGIAPLPKAITDAKRFADALRNPRIGNLLPANVEILENATKSRLESALRRLAGKASSGQTVVFYYAGHGLPTKTGEPALLPTDADISDLDNAMIPLSKVQEFLSSAKKVLLILDSCFSGTQDGNRSFAPSGRPFVAVVVPATAVTVAVLSATSKNEVSNEDSTGGFFTSALLEGMSGAADSNKDGIVSLAELAAFVANKVRVSSASKQNPQLAGSLEVTLAQNPDVVAVQSLEARVARIQVLAQANKLTGRQFLGLKKLIEEKREPRDLKDFLDGNLSESDFLELVYNGIFENNGVPKGRP